MWDRKFSLHTKFHQIGEKAVISELQLKWSPPELSLIHISEPTRPY